MEIGASTGSAPPTRDVIVNGKHPTKEFLVESWDVFVCHPRLLAIVGNCDANCHHGVHIYTLKNYDIILEEYKEIGEVAIQISSVPAVRVEISNPKQT